LNPFFECRYKVKLCVSDGTDDAVFVVFDGDMHLLVGVPCTNLVSSAKVSIFLLFVCLFVYGGLLVLYGLRYECLF